MSEFFILQKKHKKTELLMLKTADSWYQWWMTIGKASAETEDFKLMLANVCIFHNFWSS
jgi:hypothetical protein